MHVQMQMHVHESHYFLILLVGKQSTSKKTVKVSAFSLLSLFHHQYSGHYF